MTDVAAPPKTAIDRFLAIVERAGNTLPHPATLFFLLTVFVVVASAIAAQFDLSVLHPKTGEPVTPVNLLSVEGLQRIMANLVTNFTSFAPLGTVLVALIGIGVAEHSGLIGACLRIVVLNAPRFLLTPIVVFSGCMSSLAVDAGYVVLVPLGAVVLAVAGRHPLAGLAAAFAGVSGGFSANLFPSALDALLLGITQEAARLIDPTWTYVITDNYYLIIAFTFLVTLIGWAVTDLIVEPRLGPWTRTDEQRRLEESALTRGERAGVVWGTIALIVPIVLLCLLALPGGALRGEGATLPEQLGPFFTALVAGFAIAFFLAGVAFGLLSGR